MPGGARSAAASISSRFATTFRAPICDSGHTPCRGIFADEQLTTITRGL
jgi:hypothetical protein